MEDVGLLLLVLDLGEKFDFINDIVTRTKQLLVNQLVVKLHDNSLPR